MDNTQRFYLIVASFFLIGLLIYALQPVLIPFFIGGLLAYLGDPVADWFEAKGLNRIQAATIVFLANTARGSCQTKMCVSDVFAMVYAKGVDTCFNENTMFDIVRPCWDTFHHFGAPCHDFGAAPRNLGYCAPFWGAAPPFTNLMLLQR